MSIQRFLDDTSGVTSIEYGLIAAVVSLAGFTALQLMGDSVVAAYTFVGAGLQDASAGR